MGVAERKEREKIELKQSILEAAKQILLDSGQQSLSIRKIAQKIEYSPATIYLYFQDKDAILHELMDMGFSLMFVHMKEAFSIQDPVDRIEKIGFAYVSFGLQHKDWYHLMFNSDKPMKHIEKCKEDWDQGMQMFEILCQTCQEATDAKGLPHLNSRILAVQLWSGVHGLVNLALTERLDIVSDTKDEDIIPATIRNMVQTIFK